MNSPETNSPNIQKSRRALALGLSVGLAAGIGGTEAVNVVHEHHEEAAHTVIDTEHFMLNPGDSVSQDALDAAHRLVLDGKPINPASIPTSEIIYTSQEAATEAKELHHESENQPGEAFKETLYKDGHIDVQPSDPTITQ